MFVFCRNLGYGTYCFSLEVNLYAFRLSAISLNAFPQDSYVTLSTSSSLELSGRTGSSQQSSRLMLTKSALLKTSVEISRNKQPCEWHMIKYNFSTHIADHFVLLNRGTPIRSADGSITESSGKLMRICCKAYDGSLWIHSCTFMPSFALKTLIVLL